MPPKEDRRKEKKVVADEEEDHSSSHRYTTNPSENLLDAFIQVMAKQEEIRMERELRHEETQRQRARIMKGDFGNSCQSFGLHRGRRRLAHHKT